MLKRIICLVLALLFVFGAVGCGESTYEPVESTEEEARVIMTLTIDSKTYEVKYELYRTLFLTYKSEIDGGDSSVWESDESDVYVQRINELIIDRITDIYSAFAVAESIGYDVYGADADLKVEDYIRISIEGEGGIEGVGSYENYLAELKKYYMNYSVQDLMLRYSIAMDEINEYYIGTLSTDEIDSDGITVGALKYTEADVKAFYDSDECVRVLRTYLQASVSYEPEQRAENVRNKILEAAVNGETAVAYAMIANGSLIAEAEVERGYIIAKHNLDPAYYSEMTEEAFKLGVGDVSPVIEIHDGGERVFYILYRAEKSDENYNENYSHILYVYLTNRVGEIVDNAKDNLAKSISYTDVFENIEHKGIGMD